MENDPIRGGVKPIDAEEKRFINNASYADEVVYDAEKEAYVLVRKTDDPEARPDPDTVSEEDLSCFENLRRYYKKNKRRARVKTIVAVVLLLLAFASPLFLLLSRPVTAHVTLAGNAQESDFFGWKGTVTYTYSINDVKYTGQWHYTSREKEYVPKLGDTLVVRSNLIYPSWSYEERSCIPGLLNVVLVFAAGFLLYDVIESKHDNSEIRSYFEKNNMIWM